MKHKLRQAGDEGGVAGRAAASTPADRGSPSQPRAPLRGTASKATQTDPNTAAASPQKRTRSADADLGKPR